MSNLNWFFTPGGDRARGVRKRRKSTTQTDGLLQWDKSFRKRGPSIAQDSTNWGVKQTFAYRCYEAR